MANNPKIDAFLKEYGELTKKHRVDFATFPQFIPDGEGAFKLIFQTVPMDMDEYEKGKKQTLNDFIQKS